MLSDAHKTQKIVSALIFLERYNKDGDEFLSHILRVTDNETWVSKSSQSSGCAHIHQTDRKF
jgi:hypothetical protein